MAKEEYTKKGTKLNSPNIDNGQVRKLKILAVGDIHGDRELAKRLAEKAEQENVDLVVVCGDLVRDERETKGLLSYFKQKLLIIPGNHETPATINFLGEIYKGKIANLHKSFFKKEGVGFFGCGSANIGLFQLTDEELIDYLFKAESYVADCRKRVMVTHVHPSGTFMERLSSLVPGSSGVRKAVLELKPDILLCSHVHEAEGIEEIIGETKVINVGRNGKIFEI